MPRIATGRAASAVAAVLLLGACAGSDPIDVAPAEEESAAAPAPTEPEPTEVAADDPEAIDPERFPTVVDVEATSAGDGSWRFDVTLSSPYDTPERYADAWRVLDDMDTELGVRILTHDHANEQPFTRSTTVEVPAGVDTVFVEGRDQANGWSGQRFEVPLASG